MRTHVALVLTIGSFPALFGGASCRNTYAGHEHGERAHAREADDEADEEEEDEDDEKREHAEAKSDEAHETIALADAPAGVRTAIEQLTRGAKVLALERGHEDGAVVYECEYDAAGSPASATFAESGQVLELEHTVATTTLPPGVLAALKRRYPDGHVTEAETLEVRYYECVVETGGRKREVRVSPLGKIEDVE